jgi:murein L,D-transpeptidase YafK
MYSQSKTFLRDSVTIFNPKTWIPILLFYFFAIQTTSMSQSSLKNEHQSLSRVKKAYNNHFVTIQNELSNFNLEFSTLEIYIRAYKFEKVIEVYGKNKSDKEFIRLFEFPFCTLSGGLGPKREQGDLQVPEGIYYIDRFNPWSNFHLSLGINYPNVYDKSNALNNNPGGDIFIHGNCVSVGCIPITDHLIEKLYLLALEVNHNGQQKIPVHIFPQRLSSIPYLSSTPWWSAIYSSQKSLWSQLEVIDRYFNKHSVLPKITINKQGYFIDNLE